MLGREAHVGQDIGLGIIHQRRQLGHARSGLVGDLAPLLAGRRRVILGERGADPGRDEPPPNARALAAILNIARINHHDEPTTEDALIRASEQAHIPMVGLAIGAMPR